VLRVGLTGGLGSGKSTVARMLAAHGAHILESDSIGRQLMLYRDSVLRDAIVARFGNEVLQADGRLDNRVLARMAFTEGRVEELNAIVHPAVLARQEELIQRIATKDSSAVIVIESALIFETKHGGPKGWRTRFDLIMLVTAKEGLRIERYIQRSTEAGHDEKSVRRQTYAAEARKRMEHQLSDAAKIPLSDFVLRNDASLEELQEQVDAIWPLLQEKALSIKRDDPPKA
jgi:dephospho-CoA kinase